MTVTNEQAVRINLNPETVQWPEMHYVFIEKVGPFSTNAPAAWGSLHPLTPAIAEHNAITGYMSLYKMKDQIYRAGVSVAAEPKQLPEGLAYERFPGGKYSRFELRGSFAQLGPATSQVVAYIREHGIALRDDFSIEHYVTDPRVTPEDELITAILFPTV